MPLQGFKSWKNIFLQLYVAAAGEYSLSIAETADAYDRCSGVMCKKGLQACAEL